MPHDLHAPRVVIASGMATTGVSTIAMLMQEAAPALNVVEGGSRWADILGACTPGFARMIVVTTHDIVSVSSAYALIKLVRDRFPNAPIEVLVNRSEERDALRTYGRIQAAASHFLGEMVGYAGSVPDAAPNMEEESEENMMANAATNGATAVAANALIGDVAVPRTLGDDFTVSIQATMALHDLATRLDEELVPTTAGRGALRPAERRMT